MIDTVLFKTGLGKEPFSEWFEGLKDKNAKSKVMKALEKMESGLFADYKSVGEGVQEYRIHYGPGYRIYFGFDGLELIILLAGSDKSGQEKEINKAKAYWSEYKNQKAMAKKGAKEKNHETRKRTDSKRT